MTRFTVISYIWEDVLKWKIKALFERKKHDVCVFLIWSTVGVYVVHRKIRLDLWDLIISPQSRATGECGFYGAPPENDRLSLYLIYGELAMWNVVKNETQRK